MQQDRNHRTATGKFVHAEQSTDARSPLNYDVWSQAMLNTFDVTWHGRRLCYKIVQFQPRLDLYGGIDENTQHVLSGLRIFAATRFY